MSAVLRNLLLCVCLLSLSPGLRAQEVYPTTKTAWIERLARSEEDRKMSVPHRVHIRSVSHQQPHDFGMFLRHRPHESRLPA